MNEARKKEILIRNARKRMQKLRERNADFTREDALRVKVSSLNLWHRLLGFVLGFGMILGGLLLYSENESKWMLILSVVVFFSGILIFFASLFSRRNSLGRNVEVFGEGAEVVLDAIFSDLF